MWAVTVGKRTRFVDSETAEGLGRWHRDDRSFQPIADVIGAAAAEQVFSDFVRALLERALLPATRFTDLAAETTLACAPTEDGWVLKVSCIGSGFETTWDGTAETLRDVLDDPTVRDLAGQIKAERGYAGGHHPWDD